MSYILVISLSLNPFGVFDRLYDRLSFSLNVAHRPPFIMVNVGTLVNVNVTTPNVK